MFLIAKDFGPHDILANDRVVWAYHELQNLGSYSMAPPSELFGTNKRGEPRVPNLDTADGTPKREVVLPVCYRNTPWALTVAHAIGFGIYRAKGLVQFFEDPTLWYEVGYRVVDGSFTPGERVELQRAENSYPQYFAELLQPEDSVKWKRVDDPEAQYSWVAKQINKNLKEDELKHTDILVVIPDPITAKSVAARLIEALDEFGIPAHLAGVTSSVDTLYQDEAIAITGIFRAKGNEAAMVYILNSEFAVQPFQSFRGRNILLVLNENRVKCAFYAAFCKTRNWVLVAAKRCAFSSR